MCNVNLHTVSSICMALRETMYVIFEAYIFAYMYMIKSCTCICKGRQDSVRHSPKADSEKTELPRTGFEPVTTGLLVQCSAN